MRENNLMALALLGVIIGASGLGFGAYSTMQVQTGAVKGDDGDDGDDGDTGIKGIDGVNGTDGEDAPGRIVVGIIDPDNAETISGNITIRAIVAGSVNYKIRIYINGSLNATYVPFVWNSSKVADGWWNITIIATDIDTNNQSQDGVLVYIRNLELSTNVYYCTSQSEIEDALDKIGIGHGTIIITADISLSSPININGGGNYIIQSAGLVTIVCNTNDEAFYITNVLSLTIKDLKIDTSAITSSSSQGIYILEGNDNPIYIRNVQIGGGYGRGILVDSENIWVQNCILYDLKIGILLSSDSAYCHILDNSLYGDPLGGTTTYAIRLVSSHSNSILGNVVYITDTSSGGLHGIYLYDSYSNTINDNIIYDITGLGLTSAHGIRLYGSDSNTISGNLVYNIASTGTGDAYGIRLYDSYYNTLTGNVISNIQSLSNRYGIFGSSSESNAIIGNTLYNCGTAISVSGTNEIFHNVIA